MVIIGLSTQVHQIVTLDNFYLLHCQEGAVQPIGAFELRWKLESVQLAMPCSSTHCRAGLGLVDSKGRVFIGGNDVIDLISSIHNTICAFYGSLWLK